MISEFLRRRQYLQVLMAASVKTVGCSWRKWSPDLQNANMKMKYLPKPVVTAPAGMALGGGCEMAMHGDDCQPNGETYMGLVEVGVGVIPAGGGCKELAVRLTEGIPDGVWKRD